jgi:hypothetical protein
MRQFLAELDHLQARLVECVNDRRRTQESWKCAANSSGLSFAHVSCKRATSDQCFVSSAEPLFCIMNLSTATAWRRAFCASCHCCLGSMSLFRRSFNGRPNLRSLIVRTLSSATPGSQDSSQQSDQQPGTDVSISFQRAAIRSGIRWKSPCQVPHGQDRWSGRKLGAGQGRRN